MATNANPQQPLDRAIWATWYDLPEADRAAHLPWLHGEYIPGLLERPGHLWAAHYEVIGSARDRALFQPEHADDPDIGKGKDFLLLIGAASPHDFFRGTVLTVGGGMLIAIGFQDKYVDLSQTSEARTGHARCPLHQ